MATCWSAVSSVSVSQFTVYCHVSQPARIILAFCYSILSPLLRKYSVQAQSYSSQGNDGRRYHGTSVQNSHVKSLSNCVAIRHPFNITNGLILIQSIFCPNRARLRAWLFPCTGAKPPSCTQTCPRKSIKPTCFQCALLHNISEFLIMSRPREQLACALARHHFGPVVGEVVRLLLIQPGCCVATLVALSTTFFEKKCGNTKKGQTMIKLGRRAYLIRNALAVLIQHDLAYGVEAVSRQSSSNHANGKGPSVMRFNYYLIIDNVVYRLRIPLYIGFAQQRYGLAGVLIMRIMFQRGRLTSHMMFTALADELEKHDVTIPKMEASLGAMARFGLLRWSCRRLPKRQRNSRPSLNTDARVGEKRSRSLFHDSDESGSDSDGSHDDDGSIFVGRGDSRKKVGAPTRDNDTDVWTVCYWHLNREFRNDCCVKVAHLRLRNDMACRVLRIGLQLALEDEECGHPSEDCETADVSIEHIQKKLEEKDNSIPASAFWEAVQLLMDQSPRFVAPIPPHAPSKLRFIPGQLIADARRRTLQDVILARYKLIGKRAFEALAIEGAMDEKMLADRCMMHVKVVRGLVYRMYEDKLVNLQEVPRSHEQQRSNNWFYLWNVNLLSATRNLIEVMFTATHNLFLRLETLDFESTSEEDRKIVKRNEKVLMGSILRMDQSIMVMRDIGPLTPDYFPVHYKIIDGPVDKVVKKRWAGRSEYGIRNER